MAWNFTNDKPIFQQLTDFIILDIISGKYQPGEKIATVRELAVNAGVNPNTMQRALTEIEDTGIIYTKRGDGRYVVEDESIIESVRKKYVADKTEAFILSLKSLGLDDNAVLEAVKKLLNI